MGDSQKNCRPPQNKSPNTSIGLRRFASARPHRLTAEFTKRKLYLLRVISKRAIREYGNLHADSVPSLSNWLRITRKAAWRTFAELRADFGSADQVGRRAVFNVGGNKYRLIARVNYRSRRVFILHIMKHVEYVKGEWK
jgi:mRNA interferase HigB